MKGEADQLVRYFGLPYERIHVVPNGAEVRFADADPGPFAELVGTVGFVLCVGRIEPRKNQLGLLKAMRGTNVPIVILGVPIIDTAFSFFRRVVKGKSFAVADADHLHHRPVRLGHGPRRSVVILWAWTAVLSGLVLVPTFTNEGNAMVPFGIAALALLLFVYFHPGARNKRGRALAASATSHQSAEPAATEPVATESETEGAAPEAVIDLSARRRKQA